MGDSADDLKMDYDEDDVDEKETCYCGRRVTEDERVFNGEFTLCIYCQYD